MANELVLENGVWKLREGSSGGGANPYGPASINYGPTLTGVSVPNTSTTEPFGLSLGLDPYSIQNISQIVPLNLGTHSLFLGAGTESGKTPINYTSTNQDTASNLFNFEYTDSFSVSFWCKMPTFGTTNVPFVGTWNWETTKAGRIGWLFYHSNAFVGKMSFLFGTLDGSPGPRNIWAYTNGNMTFTNTDWMHFVGVWSGSSSPSSSNLTVYFDGSSQAINDNSTGTLRTGFGDEIHTSQECRLVVGAMNLDGLYTVESTVEVRIDELGIWDRALTQSEVNTLYNNGDGALCTAVSSGLVARYSMDEPSPRLGPRDIIGSNHLSIVSI